MFLTFELVDEILWCDHLNETSVSASGTMCLVCSSKFWICGQNPMVWPFKWNLFGGISTWYYFSAFYKKNWSLLEVSGLALEIVDCSCDCCFVQSTLDVPERNIAALQEADLSKGMGLKECTHAAFSVLHALQTDLSPGTSQSRHLHFKRFFQIYKCLLHLGYLHLHSSVDPRTFIRIQSIFFRF